MLDIELLLFYELEGLLVLVDKEVDEIIKVFWVGFFDRNFADLFVFFPNFAEFLFLSFDKDCCYD